MGLADGGGDNHFQFQARPDALLLTWLLPIIIEYRSLEIVDVMFIAFIVGGAGMLLLRTIERLWVRKRP